MLSNFFQFEFGPGLGVVNAILATTIFLIAWWYIRNTALKPKKPIDVFPDPDPLYNFDLETASTRNYTYVNKTIRYPYHQTMSHQPMHINHWIEIDKDLKWYLEEKEKVIGRHGKVVIDSLQESDEACGELMDLLLDYLPKRYPTLFERVDCPGGGIYNKTTNDRLTGLKGKKGVEALLVCSRLVQDDFLIASKREDGHVYFTGGLVAFPGFYLLSEKIGQSISQVHDPVPFFREKLQTSVERTLIRFDPAQPFERTSWIIVDDRNLFRHAISDNALPANFHPKDLFLRMDHQTFRKLPRTGGIVFGVHPVMKRLEDLQDSPLLPALLTKIHEESNSILMKYKEVSKYQSLILPYLREMTARQIEKGLIRGDENVAKFCELIAEGASLPSSHSSLSVPTESEMALNRGCP